MRRRIAAVRVAGLPSGLPRERPLLIAANHVSWWDGFLLREVQRILRPGAPLFTLMLEAELARFPWFRRMGVVGVSPSSPGSVGHAIRRLEALLADRPDGVVVFFPQGKIWPSHRRPLGFRRGTELFARRLSALVLPAGIHLEPLSGVAPTAFVSLGDPLEASTPVSVVEGSVERELDSILALLARHGEQLGDWWPAPYERLPYCEPTASEVE